MMMICDDAAAAPQRLDTQTALTFNFPDPEALQYGLYATSRSSLMKVWRVPVLAGDDGRRRNVLQRWLRWTHEGRIEQAQRESEWRCPVCMFRKRTHAAMPCGDLCYCRACANQLQRRGHTTCIVCRRKVESYRRSYMP